MRRRLTGRENAEAKDVELEKVRATREGERCRGGGGPGLMGAGVRSLGALSADREGRRRGLGESGWRGGALLLPYCWTRQADGG